MRVFSDFPQAINEIKRELNEMGITIKTHTMQDKYIADDESYETIELRNYCYTVLRPIVDELPLDNRKWAQQEWESRERGCSGYPENPGTAYLLRNELWDEFLHDGKFEYTYSDRLAYEGVVNNVIERAKIDIFSRQLYIPMWHPEDGHKLGQTRVPCSLGWHLMYREGKLNITYFMRSCDFHTHMPYDMYFSTRLMQYIAEEVGVEAGSFTHFMGSCHIYKKDLEYVF